MAKLKQMDKMLGSPEMRDRIQRAVDSAKEVKWLHWFNDVPVPQALAELLPQVAAAMPHIKFFPVEISRATVTGVTNCWVADEFSLYMDEFEFDLGRVGYRDYRIKRDYSKVENVFGVYSRKINNQKYSDRNDQYYMVLSTTAAKTLKNIQRYVVPYTLKELATAHYQTVSQRICSAVENVRNKVGNEVRSLYNPRIMTTEILNLKRQGVTFTTPEFIAMAEKLEELVRERDEEEARKTAVTFVRFREMGGVTYADTYECMDVKHNIDAIKSFSNPVTYELSELPEALSSGVAVLQIMECKQYAQRVGMKIDDRTFWVEKA